MNSGAAILVSTTARLFRRSRFNLLLLATVSFVVLIGLTGIRLLYLHSLGSSLSETSPHLTLLAVERHTPERLQADRETIAKRGEVEAVSLIKTGNRRLGLEAIGVGSGGEAHQFDSHVKLVGLDTGAFPFPMPLEHSTSLIQGGYPLTSRELAVALMFGSETVVVNEAFANLIRPRPGSINRFAVRDSQSQQALGVVRIVAVLRDLREEPMLYGGIQVVEQMLPEAQQTGLALRLKKLEELDRTKEQLAERFSSAYRVTTWVDQHNRQQSLFQLFDVVYWIVFTSVFVLSLIAGVLGIYRTFIAKRHSLAILLLLGSSRTEIYWSISVICGGIIGVSLLLAFGFLTVLYFPMRDHLLNALQSFLPLESLPLQVDQLIFWSLLLAACYFSLSLLFIRVIVHTRLPLK